MARRLVDPHGNHGLGRSFFDTLLKLAFPGWAFDEILQVRGEFSLDTANTVDVGVLAERQMLMIENKTRFSSITKGQVERYLETAKTKAPAEEIRLVHLLPGPPKEFPHLEKHEAEVAVVFWAQIAEILRSSCVRFNMAVTRHAATLDTEPVANGYPGGVPNRLSSNHFQSAHRSTLNMTAERSSAYARSPRVLPAPPVILEQREPLWQRGRRAARAGLGRNAAAKSQSGAIYSLA